MTLLALEKCNKNHMEQLRHLTISLLRFRLEKLLVSSAQMDLEKRP